MAAVISRATTRLGDADGDGFSRWFGGIDCDDTRADVNPLATEVPGNGVDEDCFEGDLPANAVAADRAARRAQEAPPRRRVRNLLLVTVDTMRADALTERVAPTLSEVASRSTQFTRAYTHAPMTRRAFPALLAGRYPSNIHWLDERTDNPYTVSHRDNRFLAEVLRDDGVQTAAVLAFRYARLAHFDQGFEIQRIHPASRFRRETNADVIVDDAVSLLADFRESGEPPPFFLWVHFYEPHYGYEPHEGIQTESDPRARYDGEVRYVDGELGRLFASLHDLDFAGDTAVVFTSDHGEEFGEHGGRWHGDLYPEDLRVPLFIFVPGGSPRSLDVPTGLIDLAPTMLELVGLPIPEEFDGDSLVPFIEGEPPPENRTVFAETFPDAKVERRMLALVDRRWHYIADFESGARELFDLDTDPTAQHNVYIDEPEAAVTMEELLRRHMALRVGPLRVSVADRR
jgi:arylsulfatase A-like enzyme